MAITLVVVGGPREGAAILLTPGQSIEIGRRGRDFSVPEDRAMSAAHLLLHCDATGRVTVRDLDSRNGTSVNGSRVITAALQEGDSIQAGGTVIRVGRGRPPAESDLLQRVDGPALEVLRQVEEPLYAVLDAARSPRVLELLRDSGEQYESLYEGAAAEDLAGQAPYLVTIPAHSWLLEDLLAEGWGKSWGIWAAVNIDFRELRHHFRKFLLVEIGARKFYFRFYDPRVLRAFLPTCDLQQLAEFQGPVRRFFLEDEDGRGCLAFCGAPPPPRVPERGAFRART